MNEFYLRWFTDCWANETVTYEQLIMAVEYGYITEEQRLGIIGESEPVIEPEPPIEEEPVDPIIDQNDPIIDPITEPTDQTTPLSE